MSESSQRPRRSSIKPKNYVDSPIESPVSRPTARKSTRIREDSSSPVAVKTKRNSRKSTRKASPEGSPVPVKTPKSSRKSTRKASEEPENYSPKKLRNNRTPSARALESIVTENSPTCLKIETPSRRSIRERKKNTSLEDIYEVVTSKAKRKSTAKAEAVPLDDSDSSEVVSVDGSDTEIAAKPTILFDADEDVDGQKLYSFKTPKKKDSMALLAQTTPKTPRHHDPNRGTPKTPKDNRISEIMKTPTSSRPSASKLAKTPRHVRDDIKKKLARAQLESESDGDFSASESDFEPNGESSSDSSSDDDIGEESLPPKKPQPVASRPAKTPLATISSNTPSTRRSARNRCDYVLKSDDYFSSATTKTKTSDHTLERLKNPRLPHDQLMKLLGNMSLSKEHEKAVKELNEDYKGNFDKWLTLFDEGYTILLHGFGSKRNLMQAFHKEMLSKEHVIVINGFFPSLTIKEILDSIYVDLLENASTGGNPHEIVNSIEEQMRQIPALHLFLMVHNIDGTMLRNDKAQSVLSRLASIKNIHMIASIDHINAPLIWNNTKLSNFNFVWFDVTSFLPYIEETAFENSLLVQNSGALELSSMKSVFQSLTTNARSIFILIVKYQLKNGRSPSYQGISFKELYSSCREAFLVSTDVALRAQLTEFLDHKLAKLKRTIDGAESITIPIKSFLLEQFLNEQN